MVHDTLVSQWRYFFIYWGNAEIETDSVWVFFPQYPYSNLGERVDVCLPSDAPLPSAEDTMQVFNLGPWNRELEYVEYAWYDGTKGASGRDSVVGTDSVFYYTFGRMDSVSPELYAGMLVTRVASDSLWQDSCGCYVPCMDAACSGYDTVRIFLHLLPSLQENVLLPRDSVLCAHLDLELQLPEKADAYRCFWLDKDSIELPYGHDTARFTVQGMRGLDGFGAGTDTREPRFFQLRLDHKICGVSFFDTLLVYDQVQPAFTLPVHDTLICRNEPVELDSLNPLVYRPFYVFEWNDGKKGSAYTFTDSGNYILRFFVDKAFDFCGYDTASDTIHVVWVDPALTDIFIPSDTTFCKDLSVTLDVRVPFPSTLYSWQDGPMPDPEEEFEEDTIIFNSPVKTIKEEGTYNVLLLDTMGCRNRKEINVTIDECKPSLDIPNVFTPNGDGVNDVLKFKQLEKCTDILIEIVDRWGQPVLKQKVPSADGFEWNGRVNNTGARLPDGPYFYMVSYKNLYGKRKAQSGSITILGTSE
ncbi:MAG: gliding motility-associated C-terminal domain-containing protein [Bacteroidales bacterium]|nr:gliding motility-associated C-terminal domain-containing protein [Bacteroidales bacterium]